MKTDDKVKLKDSYDVYFKQLKGQVLTVQSVFPRDREDEAKVQILEIEEIHLINMSNLEVINEQINN